MFYSLFTPANADENPLKSTIAPCENEIDIDGLTKLMVNTSVQAAQDLGKHASQIACAVYGKKLIDYGIQLITGPDSGYSNHLNSLYGPTFTTFAEKNSGQPYLSGECANALKRTAACVQQGPTVICTAEITNDEVVYGKTFNNIYEKCKKSCEPFIQTPESYRDNLDNCKQSLHGKTDPNCLKPGESCKVTDRYGVSFYFRKDGLLNETD